MIGKNSQIAKLGIFFLILSLQLCQLVIADTIIVSGDGNITASIPDETVEPTTTELVDKTDFDKLVGLTDNLIKTGNNLEKVADYLNSKEQGQNLRDSIVNATITSLIDENTQLRESVQMSKKDIEKLQDQIQTIQISLNRHQLSYWVSIVFAIGFTIFVMRIYHAYKYNKKSFWLVKYIRHLWPFNTSPPNPDEVKYKVK